MSLSTRPTFVVGCQRSGTLITSRILSEYFGADHIDELDFLPTKNGILIINKLIELGKTNLIIHCPAALKKWDEIYERIPNVRFVGVKRNTADVIASMKRIKWLQEDHKDNWEEFLEQHVKRMSNLWTDLKTTLPTEDWREVEYESLQDHPLFVSKEERKNFFVKQWRTDKKEGPRYYQEDIKWVE